MIVALSVWEQHARWSNYCNLISLFVIYLWFLCSPTFCPSKVGKLGWLSGYIYLGKSHIFVLFVETVLPKKVCTDDTQLALCPSSLPSNLFSVDCCVAGGCWFFIGDYCGGGAGSWDERERNTRTQATGCRTRSCAEGKPFILTTGGDRVTPQGTGGAGIGDQWIGWEVVEKARASTCFSCFLVVDRDLNLGARAISGSGRART